MNVSSSIFSLRGVIVRAFGVWKMKWAILQDMSMYQLEKQVRIVTTTIILHNFIRLHNSQENVDFYNQSEQFTSECNEESLGEYVQATLESSFTLHESNTQAREGVEEKLCLRE